MPCGEARPCRARSLNEVPSCVHSLTEALAFSRLAHMLPRLADAFPQVCLGFHVLRIFARQLINRLILMIDNDRAPIARRRSKQPVRPPVDGVVTFLTERSNPTSATSVNRT